MHLCLGIPERRYTTHHIRNYEPPIDRRYLYCGGTLQNNGSNPLTGDIRFTERTMTVHFCMPDLESLYIHYSRNTEPRRKHVHYLIYVRHLQKVGNQPVTADIRFTVGKSIFKGGRTFLSVTARISLYVTDYITNCSRLYQRIWMLPRLYWHVPYGMSEVIRLQVTSNSLNVP